MSEVEIGTILHHLSGGDANAPGDYVGRMVTSAVLDREENEFFLTFADGTKISIYDKHQLCCENRYMTCDDEVDCLVGGTLVHVVAKAGPVDDSNEHIRHEQVFVEIATTKGSIVITNHNKHNGYYGGFELTIMEVEAPAQPVEAPVKTSAISAQAPQPHYRSEVATAIADGVPASLMEAMERLTDEQRMSVFSAYCKHCGSTDTWCYCSNDE